MTDRIHREEDEYLRHGVYLASQVERKEYPAQQEDHPPGKLEVPEYHP
jgi:hypothetical protein